MNLTSAIMIFLSTTLCLENTLMLNLLNSTDLMDWTRTYWKNGTPVFHDSEVTASLSENALYGLRNLEEYLRDLIHGSE